MYTIIYYTNNQLSETIQKTCLDRIDKIKSDNELITVSWEPLSVGKNILIENRINSHESIYRQILKGLEASTYEHIFLCEHDVLYPESHFLSAMSPDKLIYNSNVMHLNKSGFFKAQEVNFLSTLSGSRSNIDTAVRNKIREINRNGYVAWAELSEPIGTERIFKKDSVIDIRHERNLTGYRDSSVYLDNIPYWGDFKDYNHLV